MTGTVVFVGAGPGAPGLLTLDAVAALRAADLVLYADSLVSPEIAQFVRPGVPFEGTKDRHLDDIVEQMIAIARSGGLIARVHSGDPALYGAITEQIAALRAAAVPYRIIPGVSSVFAAAAALGVELTVPDVAQTIIITRASGRTGMPEGETLRALAAHRTSLAILLGITRVRQLVEELIVGGYPPQTAVAALYRVSWPDEGIVRGTLSDIAERVRATGWTRQAVLLVGDAIDPANQDGTHRSHLYDPTYTHRFRRAARTPSNPGPMAPLPPAAPASMAQSGDLAVVSLTRNGTALGHRLARELRGTLYAPARFAPDGSTPCHHPVAETIRSLWHTQTRMLLIMPVGVAVRSLAPLLADKRSDPGVVAMDEAGQFAVSIASGHLGGANALARKVADLLGGQAVITTASDVQGSLALDLLGSASGWRIANPGALTRVSAALVNGEPVGVFQEAGSRAWLSEPEAAALHFVPDVATLADATYAAALVITYRRDTALPEAVRAKAIVYHPPCLSVGIGCERGVAEVEVAAAVTATCAAHDLALEAICDYATIDVKRDEAGLIAYAATMNHPLRFFPADDLNRPAVPNSSAAAMKAVGAQGVAEPAALLAAGARRLLVEKHVQGRVTVAVTLEVRHDD